MTVENVESVVGYDIDLQGELPYDLDFTFSIISEDDLVVKCYQPVDDDGQQLVDDMTKDVHYTVTFDSGETGPGYITILDTATNEARTGEIRLSRDTTVSQELDLEVGGSFNVEAVEDALDKLTMILQERSDSGVQAPAGVTVVFPTPVEDRLLQWADDDGTLENGPKLSEITADLAEAAASAAAAAASEAAAADWEALAEKWATEDEDVVVEDGKYSAMHWAIKAQVSTLSGFSKTSVHQTALNDADYDHGITISNEMVFRDGIMQDPSDYSYTGTVLTLPDIPLLEGSAFDSTNIGSDLTLSSSDEIVTSGGTTDGTVLCQDVLPSDQVSYWEIEILSITAGLMMAGVTLLPSGFDVELEDLAVNHLAFGLNKDVIDHSGGATTITGYVAAIATDVYGFEWNPMTGTLTVTKDGSAYTSYTDTNLIGQAVYPAVSFDTTGTASVEIAYESDDIGNNPYTSEEVIIRTTAPLADGTDEFEDSIELAQAWAINPEDTPVEATSYSALHWAAKAEDWSDLAQAWATQESGEVVEGEGYSAKYWAQQAIASASAGIAQKTTHTLDELEDMTLTHTTDIVNELVWVNDDFKLSSEYSVDGNELTISPEVTYLDAVWNSDDKDSTVNLANDDLDAEFTDYAPYHGVRVNNSMRNAKVYWETKNVTSIADMYVGLVLGTHDITNYAPGRPGDGSIGFGFNIAGYKLWIEDVSENSGYSTTTIDVIYQFAVDMATGKIWIGMDGTWFASGDPATGSTPTKTYASLADQDWFICASCYTLNVTLGLRCKESDLTYSIPTGFQAWNGLAVSDDAICTIFTTGAINSASLITDAEAWADLAQKYAEEEEDIQVETGTYSAKHWKEKAAKWAEKTDGAVEGDSYSAKWWAENASTVIGTSIPLVSRHVLDEVGSNTVEHVSPILNELVFRNEILMQEDDYEIDGNELTIDGIDGFTANTLDPSNKTGDIVLSNNNLTVTSSHSLSGREADTVALTNSITDGKYYLEFIVDLWEESSGNDTKFGFIANPNIDLTQVDNYDLGEVTGGDDNFGYQLFYDQGYYNGSQEFDISVTFGLGSIGMVAYDGATGNFWFGVDGSWVESGVPDTGALPLITLTDFVGETILPCVQVNCNTSKFTFAIDSDDWTYSAPTGFGEFPGTTYSENADLTIITLGGSGDIVSALEDAEKWAENPEDTEVETGKYSALHHAAKAEDSATAAAASAVAAATSANEAAGIGGTVDVDSNSYTITTAQDKYLFNIHGDWTDAPCNITLPSVGSDNEAMTVHIVNHRLKSDYNSNTRIISGDSDVAVWNSGSGGAIETFQHGANISLVYDHSRLRWDPISISRGWMPRDLYLYAPCKEIKWGSPHQYLDNITERATFVAGTTYTAPQIAQINLGDRDIAYKFDGTTKGFLCNQSAHYALWDLFDSLQDFTIAMNVRYATGGLAADKLLRQNSYNIVGWGLSTILDGSDFKFRFECLDCSGTQLTSDPISENTSYHVAVCSKAGVLGLYVDGVQVDYAAGTWTPSSREDDLVFASSLVTNHIWEAILAKHNIFDADPQADNSDVIYIAKANNLVS